MAGSQDPRLRSRTKIVATIGPASSDRSQLAGLMQAGVDVFRLNMAHASPDEQQTHIGNIRALCDEFDEPIAILVDLAGPKIRLGDLPDDRLFCEIRAEFFFVSSEPHSGNELTSTYPPLVKEMGVGDRMENTAEDLGGKAKEAAGKLTDNERLEAEGKMDQAKADMKNTVEDVKDAFRDDDR